MINKYSTHVQDECKMCRRQTHFQERICLMVKVHVLHSSECYQLKALIEVHHNQKNKCLISYQHQHCIGKKRILVKKQRADYKVPQVAFLV